MAIIIIYKDMYLRYQIVNETSLAGCRVVGVDGSEEMFTGCIIASHAPDTLKMLGEQATFDERRILGAFQYVYRYQLLLFCFGISHYLALPDDLTGMHIIYSMKLLGIGVVYLKVKRFYEH